LNTAGDGIVTAFSLLRLVASWVDSFQQILRTSFEKCSG